jgi:hypothetical protein
MAHHDRQRLRVADFLERVRDELESARQDAGLWRDETDRERARIANLQADAEHTEREMARLTVRSFAHRSSPPSRGHPTQALINLTAPSSSLLR